MQWITENWIMLLLVGGMIAMHLFGHGHGHGGHGGHGKQKTKHAPNSDDATDSVSDEER